ncbi:MAG TPA: hypothetical protein VHZ95_22165 [Polyangiales bacterium]|nr:hypothetical protein [Polyangiales bacterium]
MLGFLGLAVLAVAVMESDRMHTVAKPIAKATKPEAATLPDETETDIHSAIDRHDSWHSLPPVPAPPPTPPSATEPSEPIAPIAEARPPSAATGRKHVVHRMDARDPWLQPVPSALQGLPAFVRTGEPGSEAMLTTLRDYNYKNPGDARGFLLLGKLYCNRLWRTDCIGEWSSALRRDPSARGAPELLPALLQLVGQGKVADAASDLIAMAYGREALPAIEAALPSLNNSEPAARLRTLANRIEAEE